MALTILVSIYVVATVGLLLRGQVFANKFSKLTWDELRSQLAPVSMEELKSARSQYRERRNSSVKTAISPLPRGLGRKEHLERIKKNALVVIELGKYCENWRRDTGATTLELRAHGRQLSRALVLYKIVIFLRLEQVRSQGHLLVISNEYVEMIDCLLSLYREINVARYPQVRAACS